MEYLKKVLRSITLLPKTFRYSYVPPCNSDDSSVNLLDAIRECSEQGKLLIVHLTKDGAKAVPRLELPTEDFLIVTGSFNSNTMYAIARFFPIIHLPYCGLFYCPSEDFSQIQLLDEISQIEDIIKCQQHYINFQDRLLEKRYAYNARIKEEKSVEEQKIQFHELETQLLIQQMEKENLSKKEEEKKLEETLHRHQLIQKYNNLPKEPDENDDKVISIRFILPGNKIKTRMFHREEKLSNVYDYLAVDAFPQTPSISVGFPPQKISNLDLTFDDLKLSSREAFYVTYI